MFSPKLGYPYDEQTDLLPLHQIPRGVYRDAGECAERARDAKVLRINAYAGWVRRKSTDDRVMVGLELR